MIAIRYGELADIEVICNLLIETWQNSYQEFIPGEYLSSLNLERQVQRHQKYFHDSTKYYISESAQKELLGFASVGKNRLKEVDSTRELYTMYVRKPHHGRGIGLKLLHRIFEDLRKENSSLAVMAFNKNKFKRFYEKNGFVQVAQKEIDMEHFKLIGNIYKWNNLNPEINY